MDKINKQAINNAAENPFCAACKEKDCLISLDGTCEMIRKYLKYVKEKGNG